MTLYRFTAQFRNSDPRAGAYLADAQALGFRDLQRITCQDLYFVEGQLSQEKCKQLALELLTDPVSQSVSWAEIQEPTERGADALIVDVVLRPGVMDPVAEEIVRGARELGIDGVRRAATGSRFLFDGVDIAGAEQLAERLLANKVIHHWVVGEITPIFPQDFGSSSEVEIIPLRGKDAPNLASISKQRRAALDINEMRVIQDYFNKQRRDPTDVEFESIAQTWSEHCFHKTFKAKLDVTTTEGKKFQIDSLIGTYLRSATKEVNAPWVISAFVDNAGVIEFDDEFDIAFKVETHNHPSAIEPFGGANTGVGGVIRDVLGVSAKPIANTDILCFGPKDLDPDLLPDGVLHPRRIQSGVVSGVQDYGNKIGIPTVNGAILYDEGYIASPLVFCGCVGLVLKGKHLRSPQTGDRVIVLGGRTGRDGLRGATFSSMSMDAQTGEVAGASVQIGDPITEKGLIDVITRACDLGLYHAITDCGAGGLSSAVGEMATEIGAEVELDSVKLKYPGLAPWEIWLSEAQERMVLAVPTDKVKVLQKLCDTFDTELTDIGEFRGLSRLTVRYQQSVVLDLETDFLHRGAPQRELNVVVDVPTFRNWESKRSNFNVREILLKLLTHPNIASKAQVIRLYDHEVQGGTVVKPLTGVEADAPSDAAVIKPIGTKRANGIVLSNGINPEYGKRDAYRMARAAIDEAIRNAVAVGANPERIALLDNFCWGDPLRPETMGTLVEAARGCLDGALLFGAPFISGKDSLNNEYQAVDGKRHAIPPTLLISAIGIIDDINNAVTMDLKEAGDDIYLVGEFQPVFGGSHFSKITSEGMDEPVPDIGEVTPTVYKALNSAIQRKLVSASHDLSEGGLAVAAAEMCIGGRLGARLESESWDDPIRNLFGESTGSLLVEVRKGDKQEFQALFDGLPSEWIGTVTDESQLTFGARGNEILKASLDDLITAWSHAP